MIGRERSRRIVKAVDAAARAAGLQVGMPVSKAQALVPGLVMQDLKPEEDLCELERLALWFCRLASTYENAPIPTDHGT